jgi:hypothetical protein
MLHTKAGVNFVFGEHFFTSMPKSNVEWVMEDRLGKFHEGASNVHVETFPANVDDSGHVLSVTLSGGVDSMIAFSL